MKKSIVIFAICICVFFLCSGCGKEIERQAAGSGKETEKQKAGEDGLVTMSAELAEDEKNTIVTGIIFNKTEKDIETGEEYTLQVLKDKSFVDVPPLNSLAWNLAAIEILSGRERSYRIDIGHVYGDLEAGRYRIVKKYWDRENRKQKDRDSYEKTVTAEFDLP